MLHSLLLNLFQKRLLFRNLVKLQLLIVSLNTQLLGLC